MKDIKLIIWDLDGTIVDSLDISIISFIQPIKKILHKKSPKRDIYSGGYLGADEENQIIKFAKEKGASKDQLKKIYDYFVKIKKENLKKVKLFKGVDKILIYAKKNKIQQVLITGRDKAAAKIILNNPHTKINSKNMLQFFNYFLAGDEYTSKLKAFQMMKARFKVSPKNILAVGDEMKEIVSARKLGYIEGACIWGSLMKPQLKSLKPKNTFRKPKDLLEYLKRD